MRVVLAAMGVLVLGASPAWACPDTSLKAAVDLLAQAKSGANVQKLSSDIDAVAAACPADPFVLKAAAITKNNLANAAEPAGRFKLRAEAWTTWRKAKGLRAPGQPETKPIAGGGQVSFSDSYEVEKALIAALLAEEQRTGQFIPEHRPFKPGDPVADCEADWDGLGQQVRFFVGSKGWSDAGLNFLDRAIAACEASIVDKRDRTLLAARAYVLMQGVQQGKAPAGALDRAYEDAARFVAIGGYMAVWWREPDDISLRTLMMSEAVAGRGTSEADWFKPENLKKQGTMVAIAIALDKAWAEAIAGGIPASDGYKIYRDLITAQFNRAKADPNPDAARYTLAQAARMHARGWVRREENSGLQAPPDFLWNWIHPDVKL